MSIFSGWLKNANGDYVAPKTKTELVLNDDGSTLKDSLDALQNITVGTEQVIGTFNGNTLYRKIVDCGALPNATTKAVAHNISNATFTAIYGVARSTSGVTLTLPYVTDSLASCVKLNTNATSINIGCGTNLTGYSSTYVTLEYYK